jgi:alpha-tubulin suppressor-like RCC1 family protein
MQVTITDVVFVKGGLNHTFAIKKDGTLWGWGKNDDGEVGCGDTKDKSTPVQIMTGGKPFLIYQQK